MQIALVLKEGPEYGPEHVVALANTILAHNDVPVICLTDSPDINHPGVKAVPLVHGWSGWWSKIELFRECNQPTLYLDLDTVVVGKLPAIGQNFTMLANVYRKGDFGSGVMSWQQPPTGIYEKFKKYPQHYMRLYRTAERWGDQAFIRDSIFEKPDVFGVEYRSYKVHCRRRVPRDTKCVYFHGKPRPWQVKLNF